MSAPATEAQLAEIVRAAAEKGAPLELIGGGTRRGIGRPAQAAEALSLSGLLGVTLYEPEALTLVTRPGEPLAEIEKMLAEEGQRLAFEPPDWRGLLGSEGAPTIGGAVASNLSGPRRIQAGACRDSLIGVRFVDGRGDVIKNGGRVMKNVTGYDLVKLLCGSWGTLGALTEVAFKLTPAPEKTATLALRDLSDERAVAAMAAALGSPYEVTGAAHLPAAATPGGGAVTLLRLEGFAESIAHRGPALSAALAAFGAAELIEDPEEVAAGWTFVRDATPFAGAPGAVWRLSLTPSAAPRLVARLQETLGAEAFYDWGGGLVWLRVSDAEDAGAAAIRAEIAAQGGGHATLIRAGAATRAAVPPFQPEPPRLAALSARLRAAFDPKGILNPGRLT